MRRILAATLLSTAISSIGLAFATMPACAQMDQMYGMDQSDSGVSLDYFSDQLAPYGYWLYSDRWGLVWQPADVSYDFQPYFTGGRWLYTDVYGWYWQSDFPWGDIPFHFGRWVNDPDSGWLWIPGYQWSPGWVVWRSNDRYIGWMPMPPDDAFLGGRGDLGYGGLSMSFRFGVGQVGDFYGYSRWFGPEFNENMFARNWVFLPAGQMAYPDYRAAAVRDPGQIVNIIHQTRNITNFTVVNNYIVNRSVDVRVVERAAGRPIRPVRAASVIRRPNLVISVTAGQRAQVRMRMLAPRGTGMANSAPPPSERIVGKLSTRVPPARAGRPPAHLFNRAAVAAPEARARFRGAPAPASGPAEAPGAQHPGEMPPNGERPGREPPGMGGPGAQRPGEMPPNGERPGREPPGMAGPNGGPPGAQRPGEMPPNGAYPGREHPGMAGPYGGPPPNGERPGGMTGPNGGPPDAQRPGEMPPSGAYPGREHPGMGGPNGGPPPNGEHPGGMTGPNGGPPGPNGQYGGMGPGGEHPHPAGAMGPNGGPPGGGMAGPGAERPRPPQPAAPQRTPQHPPAKKEPPKNPPQPQ